MICFLATPCKCQGLFDHKFATLHHDRNCGITSADKLWRESRDTGKTYPEEHAASEFTTCCTCCKSYREWKLKHPALAKRLQTLADTPIHYVCCPDEIVQVPSGAGECTQYTGTIRALGGAPKGACTGKAVATGDHPYICDACNALVHGKSSPLLRKLHRSCLLTHPRTKELRATKVGVTHKFCSSASLEKAIQHHQSDTHMKERKMESLESAQMHLLHESWHGVTHSIR